MYEHLKPFERKELMKLILVGAEVNERQIVLEIDSGACLKAAESPKSVNQIGRKRFAPPDWLPEAISRQNLPAGL